MITAYPGFKNVVETVTIDNIKRFGKEIVVKTLQTGGFYCSAIPKGVVELIPVEIKAMAKPYELDILQMFEGGNIVQVVKEFQTHLSEKDLRTILFHEEGHIVLGHTTQEYQSRCKIENGILVDVKTEIEADLYAASKVGKKAVSVALTHLIENICLLDATKLGTVPLNRERYQNNISEVLLSPMMRARFEALR